MNKMSCSDLSQISGSELYLVLYWNDIIRKYCDFFETLMNPLKRVKKKKRKAVAFVCLQLPLGVSKKELVEYVVDSCMYSPRHAQRIVNKIIGEYDNLFIQTEDNTKIGMRLLKNKMKPLGEWGVPYSRPSKGGRPPTKLQLKEIGIEVEERLFKIFELIGILTGTSKRLQKIVIDMTFGDYVSDFPEIVVDYLKHIYTSKGEKIPDNLANEIKDSYNTLKKNRDELKQKIDNYYDKKLEPFKKSANKYLESLSKRALNL